MQLGMIGLGRMGANMVRRLLRGGHSCVGFDRDPVAVQELIEDGATGAHSSSELTSALSTPRVIWIMVPAAVVDRVLSELVPLLEAGDIVIDGGNSNYREDIRRAEGLTAKGIHYVDVGTSGGIQGLERGYCLMIGGEPGTVKALQPIFATLAPEKGYLHCGPHGAGHFVKMVHNGIEYGLMAAYAEGFNILEHADAGIPGEGVEAGRHGRSADAETAPLSEPRYFQYRFDIAAIAEVWRHGSIIGSHLLDMSAAALAADPQLSQFAGHVADSGEGRWTIQAAIEEGVPVHVLSAALYSRFASRGRDEFANKVLSAMRLGFGGHFERKAGPEAIESQAELLNQLPTPRT